MRERATEIAGLGATVIAAGFSPPVALAALAASLEWPFLFLSDEERVLYRRLGLGAAEHAALVTPGTLRIYRDARRRGQAVRRPVEDHRQLGGDAIVRQGIVLRVFRPRSPDDRPSPEALLAALRDVHRGG